jgi:PHD/YefM family antitoxin component YafN of YafNO toxin-antitoxin module
MTRHEPKCITWKRRGAELVAADVAELDSTQENQYWRQRTETLRQIQERLHVAKEDASDAQQGAAPDRYSAGAP